MYQRRLFTFLGLGLSFRNKLLNCLFVVAVNKPVTISSIYQPAFKPSHAVDDITVCSKWDLHIKSNLQFRPWIKIDFQGIYNVHSVVIYNTQNGQGKCINF